MEYLQMLAEWKALKSNLETMKEREMQLRKLLFEGAFPTPKEGVNKVTLVDGTVVKGTYKLNRKIDPEKWGGLASKLDQQTLSNITKVKTELVVGAFNKLAEETKKVVEGALIIKPGAPELEVIDAD